MSYGSIEQYYSKSSDTRIMHKLVLNREDEGGVVFISCDDLPDLFIATFPEEVREAIDAGLKAAYAAEADRVQVFTNGRLSGPTIDTLVNLTSS